MGRILDDMHINWIDAGIHPMRPEYAKCQAAATEKETKLRAMLDGEAKALFDEFIDSNGELLCVAVRESFAHGFSVGALLMQEIIRTKAEILGE